MNFSDEDYRRVYIPDTTKWRRMKWDGQALFMLVLRKLDREGRLSLEGCDPAEVIELHIDAPMEFIEGALSRCLKSGFLAVEGDHLISPDFRKAQDAPRSNRFRQAQLRARKKEVGEHEITDDFGVTQRDEALPSVTKNNEVSRAVTKSNATNHPTTQPPIQPTPQPAWADASDGPPGQLIESVAQAYLDVTGLTDLSPIPTDRDLDQRKALSKMAAWCGGNVPKLRDELLALKTDPFVAKQSVEYWAKRVGTVPKPEPIAVHPAEVEQRRLDAEAKREGRVKKEPPPPEVMLEHERRKAEMNERKRIGGRA